MRDVLLPFVAVLLVAGCMAAAGPPEPTVCCDYAAGDAVVRVVPSTARTATVIQVFDAAGQVPAVTFAPGDTLAMDVAVGPGSYRVRINGRDCMGSFQVAERLETTATVALAPDGSCAVDAVAQSTPVPPSRITGRVNAPDPTALSVELWSLQPASGDPPLTSATPDASGFYALDVTPGGAEIRVVRGSEVLVRRTVLVATGASLNLDLAVPDE